MPKIFVSYRRGDLPDLVDRIIDHLGSHFGKEEVFRDIDGIEPSTDFARKLGDALRECKVLVALIGPDWTATTPDGRHRIDHEDDWVRIELSVGMTINLPVVPVVLNQATLPSGEALPRQIRSLHQLQALRLESGRTFPADIAKLISAISRYTSNAPQYRADVESTRTWFAAFLAIGKWKISLSIVACLFIVIAAGLLIGRTTNADYSGQTQATGFVIKAGKPVVTTSAGTSEVR